jgi:hypothetical protein
MAKLTLTNIQSGYASVDALNANFTAIESALENTLSRDGTSPNVLTADLDLNGNSILNARATSGDANFLWKGSWTTGETYSANNLVYATEGTNLGNGLICTEDHVAGASLDGDAAYWDIYVLKGSAVGGIAGPVSSVINYIPQWNDVGGTELKGGIPVGELAAIAALSVADGNIIVGNGSTWVAESGATARTSLGAQETLVSNTNIKTVNGATLLGSGEALPVPGPSGNQLTSDGTVWTSTAAPSTAGWVLISPTEVTSVAALDFIWDEAIYGSVLLLFDGVGPATNNTDLRIRFGYANGGTIDTTANYHYANLRAGGWDIPTASQTSALLIGGVGNLTTEVVNATIEVTAAGSSTSGSASYRAMGSATQHTGTSQSLHSWGACQNTTVRAYDTVRVYWDSGNFAAKGTIKMYGLKRS